MPDPAPRDSGDDYLAAVELLVRGRAADAVPVLSALARGEAGESATLALGKCHLELRQGAEARACFRRLLTASPPPGPALAGYLRLLDAFAAALCGDAAAAESALHEVGGADPRLESTVRSLRRQIQTGRTPLLRL